MKKLVIIPTYNERENIEAMIEKVMSLEGAFDLLVVDDLPGEPHDVPLTDVLGQLAVVGLRLQCFLVAVHADVPHSCRGEQHVHAVYHAKSRAQDRYNGNGVVIGKSH